MKSHKKRRAAQRHVFFALWVIPQASMSMVSIWALVTPFRFP